MTVANDTSCLCPNCKTDLKKVRYTQVQAHFYIDNMVYPGMADYVKYLKSKNQLNKIVLAALDQYKKQSVVDLTSISKAISRIESVLDITSDKSAVLSIKKQLDLITASIS